MLEQVRTDLISVIVPVYKVEKYLSKCVDSICKQTYEQLEIILVDDGSPDNCGKICEEFAGKDRRIHVIHKENGGLSDARNAGIQIATGKYIMFVDSDDYLHLQMVEILHKNLKRFDADLSVCGLKYIEEFEKGDMNSFVREDSVVIESDSERLSYFFGETQTIFTVAWNKLYKREQFDNLCYPKEKLHEDEFVTYKILDRAKRIVYIKDELYFYVQHKDSITGRAYNTGRLDRLEALVERMDYYFAQERVEFYRQTLFLYRVFLLQYQDKMQNIRNDYKLLFPYQQIYKKQVKNNLRKVSMPWKEKMSYYMYCYFPKLYYKQYRKKQEAGVYYP